MQGIAIETTFVFRNLYSNISTSLDHSIIGVLSKAEMAKGMLSKGADIVVREALISGEVERGALPSLLGVSDRQARKVTAELLAVGALKSDTQRAPLRLSFPATLASDWMPGLFPER